MTRIEDPLLNISSDAETLFAVTNSLIIRCKLFQAKKSKQIKVVMPGCLDFRIRLR